MSTDTYRDDAPGPFSGRLFRITGMARNGIVTAVYRRGEEWREVVNEHRRAVLTVRHTGTLPAGYPDSVTRAAVLPRLQREAQDLTPAEVPRALGILARLTRDNPEDVAAFCDALEQP